MKNRRKLLIGLSALSITPRRLFAQAKKEPVLIAWLSLDSRESAMRSIVALKEGLSTFGWTEGVQIRIEERWANGRVEQLPVLVEELATKKPALIVASGQRVLRNVVTVAPKIATVFVTDFDPVASKLVVSFARPGGVITGVAGFNIDTTGKSLELLLAAAPKLRRVGFLADTTASNRTTETARQSVMHYAVDARFVEVGNVAEIEPALSQLVTHGVQGLVILPGALLRTERRRILKFALAQRWPVVGGAHYFAEEGALLTYGSDFVATHRRAAFYVDRILKGTKPGDLPIERPMTFEMVVNMKTAKALGLTMPPEIMVRATRVIE